eukprot:TRINITY_DN7183_c0_g2_i1.p4 TRINITY_DN7183_c0_g2~~TRINITY_DN7183_c0_g2_i1.p4  ORF type:complete len:160 (+),score=60.68 TRINITY_DN7183_c0_g2_i1:391-870(+)
MNFLSHSQIAIDFVAKKAGYSIIDEEEEETFSANLPLSSFGEVHKVSYSHTAEKLKQAKALKKQALAKINEEKSEWKTKIEAVNKEYEEFKAKLEKLVPPKKKDPEVDDEEEDEEEEEEEEEKNNKKGSRKRHEDLQACLLYTSPSPRDLSTSRMPSSA